MGILDYLNGKKSFLGIIALGVIGFAESSGWIEPTQAEAYRQLAYALTGAGLVHKAEKLLKKKSK